MRTTLETVDGRRCETHFGRRRASKYRSGAAKTNPDSDQLARDSSVSIQANLIPAMERYWDTRCKFGWSFVVATLLLCSSRVPATTLAQTHPGLSCTPYPSGPHTSGCIFTLKSSFHNSVFKIFSVLTNPWTLHTSRPNPLVRFRFSGQKHENLITLLHSIV